LQVVDNSKIDSVKSSAEVFAKAAVDYYSNELLSNNKLDKISLTDDTLTISSGEKPDRGYAFYDKEGNSYIKMYYKGYCVERDFSGNIKTEKMESSECEIGNMQSVTLYGNGGIITAPNVWTVTETYATIMVDFATSLGSFPTVSRPGYTFKGWYDENDNLIALTKPVVENISGTAKWEVNKYTVTLDFTGANIVNVEGWTLVNGVYTKVMEYDTEYGSLPELSKTGYTFLGWYTTNGIKIESDTILTTPDDHKLIAQWSANKYIVTFKYNDNKTSDTTKEITYNSSYGDLPAPNRIGYTFLGWYSGEEQITKSKHNIIEISYDKPIKVNEKVIKAVKEADLIIFSSGSLYTSIIPHLINKELVKAIANSKAKRMYLCNLFTQPGETDDYTVSDHIKIIEKYLGKKTIDIVLANSKPMSSNLALKYSTNEQKDPVVLDKEELEKLGIYVICDKLYVVEGGYYRHDSLKTAYHIFSYLMEGIK